MLKIFSALFVILGAVLMTNPPPNFPWIPYLIVYFLNFAYWMKSMEGNMTPGGMD